MTDARNVARKLGRFTTTEFAQRLGIGRASATKKILWMVEELEIVRPTGERKKHGGPGRPAPVYEYIPPPASPPPERRPTPEEELRRQLPKMRFLPPRRALPSGRRVRIPHREIRQLAAEATKVGWTIKRTSGMGGHYWLVPPKGVDAERILLPQSPTDWRSIHNIKALMRKSGIPV